ncbi:transporter substrate-binding domain-containing protein [Arthrobacter sp. NA-172]|uniref:transporter substrate-binding domain-containing protein n=1 Tax=Arthrobacter sp. NA-172 TaxID=3367524 RepID=UPI0037553A7C
MMRKGVKGSIVAAAAVSFMVLTTACSNVEGAAATASGNASGGSSKGAQSGQELALAVTPDSKVQALLPSAIKSKGSLTLVTDPTYAPIDFTDEQGKIVGLEPDMALAVAKKMGVTINIEKADFNGILAGIEARRYDASWAAFSITEERKDKVNMVSYMRGGTSVMVKKGNPLGINSEMDLCGKTVAAQTGTTQALSVLPGIREKVRRRRQGQACFAPAAPARQRQPGCGIGTRPSTRGGQRTDGLLRTAAAGRLHRRRLDPC